MYKPRNLVLAVAGLVLLAVPAAGEPLKIRNGWIVPVSNLASILFAKDGVARHNGQSYVMEPVRFQGSPQMATALATGELEISLLAFSSFSLAIQNAGMDDLKIIADDLDALQSNIDKLAELGFLKARITVKNYVDLSLVEEAAKRLD